MLDYYESSGYRWKLSLKKPWRVSVWMVLPLAATRAMNSDSKRHCNKNGHCED